MNIEHGNHRHEVRLLGIDFSAGLCEVQLDACICVDDREARHPFLEADRTPTGRIKLTALADAARLLCDTGELDEEAR